MLSLQFSDTGRRQRKADSGLRALFNVASGGGSGGVVTTGVRGLSEADLKDAKPDSQALQTVQGYAVNKSEAAKFAKAGKLSTQEMDYLSEPAREEEQ